MVEPSENAHVATKPRLELTLTVGFAGVTVILESVTGATHVTVVVPEIEPTAAVTTLLPAVKQFTG